MALYSKDRPPVVICAICNKPVDKITMETFYLTMTICFKVECHGDTDYCEIPEETVYYDPDAIKRGGTAFTVKRLTEQPK